MPGIAAKIPSDADNHGIFRLALWKGFDKRVESRHTSVALAKGGRSLGPKKNRNHEDLTGAGTSHRPSQP